MKKAFTLIELLIVIGIIAILAGVLMGNYSGIIARVRSTKCATNLKNLANAVNIYAMESGRYPYAESAQYITTAGYASQRDVQIGEFKGWVSWLSKDIDFPITGNNPRSISHCSYANETDEDVTYALTNGAIWSAVGKNRDSYLCPVHLEKCRQAGVPNPGWSYKMNAYFGYESTPGKASVTQSECIRNGSLTRADRILLFAEIPALTTENSKEAAKFAKLGVKLPEANLTGGNDDSAMCGCLLTKGSAQNQNKGGQASSGSASSIGFNHTRGKTLVGHVAFADGHVETLDAPKDGNFEDLTDWLCAGLDIVRENKSYRKIDDSDDE